jgi:hypothetical protein
LQEGILISGKNRADSEDETLRDGKCPDENHDQSNRSMTPEELLKMRMEILPQL